MKNPLSASDRALFRAAVEQLSQPDRASGAGTQNDLGASFAWSDTIAAPVTAEASLFFSRAPIAPKVLKRSKAGQFIPQARLDLHGCHTEQARTELTQFLKQAYQHDLRYLLLVHGKGRDPDRPVLKNLVNRWLPQIEWVQWFMSAHHKHGGAGALYVALSKR